MKSFAIGIDPGKSNGFAVYDREAGRLAAVETIKGIFPLIERVKTFAPSNADIILESTMNMATFRAHESDAAQDRMSRNVGAVQAVTAEILQALRSLRYNVKTVLPIRGKKMSEESFRLLTGWEGKTSQHARDAGRLCWRSLWELDHRVYSVAEIRVADLNRFGSGFAPISISRPDLKGADVRPINFHQMHERAKAAITVAEERAEGRQLPLVVIRSNSGDYLDGFAVRATPEGYQSITLEALRAEGA